MVRRVFPIHKQRMEKDIIREKNNTFLCMHPAVSVVSPYELSIRWDFYKLCLFQEQERVLYQLMDKEENTSEKWFQMHKAYKEATTHAPLPLKNHYDGLNMTGTWQKYWLNKRQFSFKNE